MNYEIFKKEYFNFVNNSSLNVMKIKTKKNYIDRMCCELGLSPSEICIGYEKCLDIDFIVFRKK